MGPYREPLTTRNDSKPLCIRFLEYTNGANLSFKTHQAIVLIVTFLAYASYHATRKTISIVESALDPESSESSSRKLGWMLGDGWAPFNASSGASLLGEIDVAFLAVYSIGMFFSGHIGDRVNIRIFLTVGMVGTSLFTSLFGAGYWLNIHNFYYFLVVQMLAGLFQSTGWPSVVAIVGNWFGKKRRGLIMGIWNAHTSVGNICGSLIASALLQYGWGWSFVVPGLIIAFLGLVVLLLLPVSPDSVNVDISYEDHLQSLKKGHGEDATEPLLRSNLEGRGQAVGFIEAWKIPGVATFAFCLFFAKLVAYTFLYWLPFYLTHTGMDTLLSVNPNVLGKTSRLKKSSVIMMDFGTISIGVRVSNYVPRSAAIDGEYISDEAAGNLSTLFDVGGIIGGVLAGHISDWLNARAITSASFMYCAIAALFLYRSYGHISLYLNAALMLITGLFVNGPYALITTAVSADLGTHASLRENSRALATVSAILDGTGSVGAALGPLLTGYISAWSWSLVFTMLMTAALVAGLLLTQLVITEVWEKIEEWKSRRRQTSTSPVADAGVV